MSDTTPQTVTDETLHEVTDTVAPTEIAPVAEVMPSTDVADILPSTEVVAEEKMEETAPQA